MWIEEKQTSSKIRSDTKQIEANSENIQLLKAENKMEDYQSLNTNISKTSATQTFQKQQKALKAHSKTQVYECAETLLNKNCVQHLIQQNFNKDSDTQYTLKACVRSSISNQEGPSQFFLVNIDQKFTSNSDKTVLVPCNCSCTCQWTDILQCPHIIAVLMLQYKSSNLLSEKRPQGKVLEIMRNTDTSENLVLRLDELRQCLDTSYKKADLVDMVLNLVVNSHVPLLKRVFGDEKKTETQEPQTQPTITNLNTEPSFLVNIDLISTKIEIVFARYILQTHFSKKPSSKRLKLENTPHFEKFKDLKSLESFANNPKFLLDCCGCFCHKSNQSSGIESNISCSLCSAQHKRFKHRLCAGEIKSKKGTEIEIDTRTTELVVMEALEVIDRLTRLGLQSRFQLSLALEYFEKISNTLLPLLQYVWSLRKSGDEERSGSSGRKDLAARGSISVENVVDYVSFIFRQVFLNVDLTEECYHRYRDLFQRQKTTFFDHKNFENCGDEGWYGQQITKVMNGDPLLLSSFKESKVVQDKRIRYLEKQGRWQEALFYSCANDNIRLICICLANLGRINEGLKMANEKITLIDDAIDFAKILSKTNKEQACEFLITFILTKSDYVSKKVEEFKTEGSESRSTNDKRHSQRSLCKKEHEALIWIIKNTELTETEVQKNTEIVEPKVETNVESKTEEISEKKNLNLSNIILLSRIISSVSYEYMNNLVKCLKESGKKTIAIEICLANRSYQLSKLQESDLKFMTNLAIESNRYEQFVDAFLSLDYERIESSCLKRFLKMIISGIIKPLQSIKPFSSSTPPILKICRHFSQLIFDHCKNNERKHYTSQKRSYRSMSRGSENSDGTTQIFESEFFHFLVNITRQLLDWSQPNVLSDTSVVEFMRFMLENVYQIGFSDLLKNGSAGNKLSKNSSESSYSMVELVLKLIRTLFTHQIFNTDTQLKERTFIDAEGFMNLSKTLEIILEYTEKLLDFQVKRMSAARSGIDSKGELNYFSTLYKISNLHIEIYTKQLQTASNQTFYATQPISNNKENDSNAQFSTIKPEQLDLLNQQEFEEKIKLFSSKLVIEKTIIPSINKTVEVLTKFLTLHTSPKQKQLIQQTVQNSFIRLIEFLEHELMSDKEFDTDESDNSTIVLQILEIGQKALDLPYRYQSPESFNQEQSNKDSKEVKKILVPNLLSNTEYIKFAEKFYKMSMTDESLEKTLPVQYTGFLTEYKRGFALKIVHATPNPTTFCQLSSTYDEFSAEWGDLRQQIIGKIMEGLDCFSIPSIEYENEKSYFGSEAQQNFLVNDIFNRIAVLIQEEVENGKIYSFVCKQINLVSTSKIFIISKDESSKLTWQRFSTELFEKCLGFVVDMMKNGDRSPANEQNMDESKSIEFDIDSFAEFWLEKTGLFNRWIKYLISSKGLNFEYQQNLFDLIKNLISQTSFQTESIKVQNKGDTEDSTKLQNQEAQSQYQSVTGRQLIQSSFSIGFNELLDFQLKTSITQNIEFDKLLLKTLEDIRQFIFNNFDENTSTQQKQFSNIIVSTAQKFKKELLQTENKQMTEDEILAVSKLSTDFSQQKSVNLLGLDIENGDEFMAVDYQVLENGVTQEKSDQDPADQYKINSKGDSNVEEVSMVVED